MNKKLIAALAVCAVAWLLCLAFLITLIATQETFFSALNIFGRNSEPNPHIKTGEFPLLLEYELDGERYIIEDTVFCEYKGQYVYSDYRSERYWSSRFMKLGEGENTAYELWMQTDAPSFIDPSRENFKAHLYLFAGTGDYYMGESDGAEDARDTPGFNYKEYYYEPGSTFPPMEKTTRLTNAQLEEYFGIKVIRFEHGSPIVNAYDK